MQQQGRHQHAHKHQRLRELMAQRESQREGVDVDPEHLIITNGSMQVSPSLRGLFT